MRDFDQAEDIFQDTMLQFLNNKDKFNLDADFLLWAKGIARNMVRRHWKAINYSRNKAELLSEISEIVLPANDSAAQWKDEKDRLSALGD